MKPFPYWWAIRLFSVFHRYKKCLTEHCYICMYHWLIWPVITMRLNYWVRDCMRFPHSQLLPVLQKVVSQLTLPPSATGMLFPTEAVDGSILIGWQLLGLGNGLVGVWLYIALYVFRTDHCFALLCFHNTQTYTHTQCNT